MTTSELDDVTALLERVLPNPAGFAERLGQQFITVWAGGDLPTASRVVANGKVQARDDVIDTDTMLVLAAALGACDCWGMRADCRICAGEGASGWTEPDVELFREFVGPALARLSAHEKPPASPETSETTAEDHYTDGDSA